MGKRTVVFMMLLAAFLFAVTTCQVLANDESALVVDSAGIFNGKIHQVEQAALRLQREGAIVHVRTINRFSGETATLEEYYENLLRKYPSWRKPGTHIGPVKAKGNLVVLMVAVKDRTTGLYYGDEWKGTLKKNWTRIQVDLMNPKFRQGDWAGGFVAGLDEVSRLINNYLHPSAAAQPAVVVSGQPAQPTDFSGLWRVFMWIVILTFLCLIAYYLIGLWMKRRREQQEKDEAQQRAKIERAAAGKTRTQAKEAIDETEPLVAVIASALCEAEGESLKKELEGFKKSVATFAKNFSSIDSSAGDPDAALTTGQYKAIESKFKLLNDDGTILVRLQEFKEKVARLRDLIGKIPGESDRLQKLFAGATAAVDAVEKKGFKVDGPRGILKEAAAQLKSMVDTVGKKAYENFSEFAAAAEKKCQEAGRTSLELIACKEAVDKRAADLDVRLGKEESAVANAKKVFASLCEKYSKPNWQALAANPDKAERALYEVASLLSEARKLAGMDAQDWEGAKSKLGEAEAKLNEASQLGTAITTLKEKLEFIKAGAQAESLESQGKITEAWGVVNKDDLDVSPEARVAVEGAEQALAAANNELETSRPDYLAVERNLQAAKDGAAQGVLLERKRQTDAVVQEARVYYEKNRGRMSRRQLRRYEEMEENYGRMQQSGSLDGNELLMLYLLTHEQSQQVIVVSESHGRGGYLSDDELPRSSGPGGWQPSEEKDLGGGDTFFGSAAETPRGGGGETIFAAPEVEAPEIEIDVDPGGGDTTF